MTVSVELHIPRDISEKLPFHVHSINFSSIRDVIEFSRHGVHDIVSHWLDNTVSTDELQLISNIPDIHGFCHVAKSAIRAKKQIKRKDILGNVHFIGLRKIAKFKYSVLFIYS